VHDKKTFIQRYVVQAEFSSVALYTPLSVNTVKCVAKNKDLRQLSELN